MNLLNNTRRLLAALAVLCGLSAPVAAQGSIPVALQQISDQNGHPYVGALLYFYQVGTVATRQDSFQDTGLTLPNQWPLPTDAFGRVPMFYLASGSIHVRLTDPNGLVIFDYPSMLVIGPSGGGGGGGAVDPTTIAATGDIKFRLTTETLTGWVRLNALTIGSAVSGATGRANGDTQNLFTYLWNNCTNAHCPVSGGRGASGLADFNANKTIGTPDCRGRICMVGLDDMGNVDASRLAASNITSGGGDGVSTPLATGGESNHTITQAQLPAVGLLGTGTITQSQTFATGGFTTVTVNAGVSDSGIPQNLSILNVNGFSVSTTTQNMGSGTLMNVMNPFALGTYYMKM